MSLNPRYVTRPLKAGKRLEYWLRRNRFQYKDRVMTGDVLGFIRKKESKRAWEVTND